MNTDGQSQDKGKPSEGGCRNEEHNSPPRAAEGQAQPIQQLPSGASLLDESNLRAVRDIVAAIERWSSGFARAEQVEALSRQVREFATEAKERQEADQAHFVRAFINLHHLGHKLFCQISTDPETIRRGEMLKARVEEYLAGYGIVPLVVSAGDRFDPKTMSINKVQPTLTPELDQTVAKIQKQGWEQAHPSQPGVFIPMQPTSVEVFRF